jgi:hypothetical protein
MTDVGVNVGLDELLQEANKAREAQVPTIELNPVDGQGGGGVSPDLFERFLGGSAPAESTWERAEIVETAANSGESRAALEALEAKRAQASGVAVAEATRPTEPEELSAETKALAEGLRDAANECRTITDIVRWDRQMERKGFGVVYLYTNNGDAWIPDAHHAGSIPGIASGDYFLALPSIDVKTGKDATTQEWFDRTGEEQWYYIEQVSLGKRVGDAYRFYKKGKLISVPSPTDAPYAAPTSKEETPVTRAPSYVQASPSVEKAPAAPQPQPVEADSTPKKKVIPEVLTNPDGTTYDPREEKHFAEIAAWLMANYKVNEQTYLTYKVVAHMREIDPFPWYDSTAMENGFPQGLRQMQMFKDVEDKAITALGIIVKEQEAHTLDTMRVGNIRTDITQGVSQALGAAGDVVHSSMALVRDVTGTDKKRNHEEVTAEMPEELHTFAEALARGLSDSYTNHVVRHMDCGVDWEKSQYLNRLAASRDTKGKAAAKAGSPIGLRWTKFTEIKPEAVAARKLSTMIGTRAGVLRKLAPTGMLVVSVLKTDPPGNVSDILFFMGQVMKLVPEDLVILELTSTSSASGMKHLDIMEEFKNISAFGDFALTKMSYWVWKENTVGAEFLSLLEAGYPEVWKKLEDASSATVMQKTAESAPTSDVPPPLDQVDMHPDQAVRNQQIHAQNSRKATNMNYSVQSQNVPFGRQNNYDNSYDQGNSGIRTVSQILIFILTFIPRLMWNIISLPFRGMFNRDRYNGYNNRNNYNSPYGNGYQQNQGSTWGRNRNMGYNKYNSSAQQTRWNSNQRGMNSQYNRNNQYNNNGWRR